MGMTKDRLGQSEQEGPVPKSNREKEFICWFTRCPGVGAVAVKKAGERTGGFENVYYIEGTELRRTGILRSEKQYLQLDEWKKELESMRQEYHSLPEKGIRFVTPLNPEYPKRLGYVYDYPMGLYVKGKLPKEEIPTAAVTGARNRTFHGKQSAEYINEELAGQGVQVISGLVLGIDGVGHMEAVKGGGRTFAVLGYGVNICYPKTNHRLFEQILEKGGIISEYAPQEEPCARNFPVRNRIISGPSDAILVTEAGQKSGPLITAQPGLEQGKDIYVLPDRITDPLSQGRNYLIRTGAGILISPLDVLEDMGIFYEKQRIFNKKDNKGLARIGKMVYSCLDSEPRNPGQTVVLTGLSVSLCTGALLELELGGYAMRVRGQYYI